MAHKIHTTRAADTADAWFTDISVAELAALLGASAITSVSPSGGVGYATGAGGVVVQGTSKSTAVQLDTVTGKITLNNEALNAATIVAFTLTNSQMLVTDNVVINHVSAGTSGAYTINIFPANGSAVISVRNNTAGNLSEAIVLRFSIIRSANA